MQGTVVIYVKVKGCILITYLLLLIIFIPPYNRNNYGLQQGEHGIEEDVFLSLPCVLGSSGVLDVIRQPLTEKELSQLRKSAEIMAQVQAGIKF